MTNSLVAFLFLAQHHHAPPPVEIGGLFSRLALVGLTITFYLGKALWPFGLLPIYPQWPVNPPAPYQFLPWLAFAGLFFLLWRRRHGWGRHLLLGLGFFLLNLAPFTGLRDISYMNFTWVMDHFLYIPIIGIIGLAVAAGEILDAKRLRSFHTLFVVTAASFLVFFAIESRGYAGVFISQEKLWTYTVQGNPGSAVAHNNLGTIFFNHNQLPESVEQYREAVRLDPTYADAHNGLGSALIRSGQASEAIDHYREAIRLDPNLAEAHNGLANALLQGGHLPEARAESDAALKLKPHYAEAHCTLGLILAQEGYFPEAIAEFETAQVLSPDDPRIKQELAVLRVVQKAGGLHN